MVVVGDQVVVIVVGTQVLVHVVVGPKFWTSGCSCETQIVVVIVGARL